MIVCHFLPSPHFFHYQVPEITLCFKVSFKDFFFRSCCNPQSRYFQKKESYGCDLHILERKKARKMYRAGTGEVQHSFYRATSSIFTTIHHFHCSYNTIKQRWSLIRFCENVHFQHHCTDFVIQRIHTGYLTPQANLRLVFLHASSSISHMPCFASFCKSRGYRLQVFVPCHLSAQHTSTLQFLA